MERTNATSDKKFAIIIGAGPAGLTAAIELLERSNIQPIIFEKTNTIGGISRTVNYKGNRMDIGGHRFFSKSDRVMEWWKKILPPQGFLSKDELSISENYHGVINNNLEPGGPDPERTNQVMLIRNRLSRIFFIRKFFDYPVSLNIATLHNLGMTRILKITFGYIKISLFPIKKEENLEDFFINRFGKELYFTFFRDYTEKVWGVPCRDINPEWGAQRVKGLSVFKTIVHALKKRSKSKEDFVRKKIETSLIENFLYPKFGPGQLWEDVAQRVTLKGGVLLFEKEVLEINCLNKDLVKVLVRDTISKVDSVYEGNYIFSTMPIKDLIKSILNPVSEEVKRVAEGLLYRDFMTVGLLLKKLNINNKTTIPTLNNLIPDNWIYIQEKDVKLGRLQIFNNWSPYMVADSNNVWIGLEYFCNEGDELWSMGDNTFIDFAIAELQKIDLIDKNDVLDSTLIRVPKAYPAYFGTYNELGTVIQYVNSFSNLFLIGRNGMHRYNNQDHSMLTAMVAVDGLIEGNIDKNLIWQVNTEEDYHEKTKQEVSVLC